jgi:AbiTii
MSSLVIELQKDIISSKKTVTEILRTAKLISAKLGLTDISQLIDSELGGYHDQAAAPKYREVTGGTLYVFNPVRGWVFAGNLSENELTYRISQPVSELEELAKAPYISTTSPEKFNLTEPFMMQFPQEVRHSTMEVKRILEAIKEQILNWVIELEQRGIMGEDMSFDKKEKQKAQHQTFNIQHFAGVLGDVTHSNVNVYDYSSIHQELRKRNIPQAERNEIENILDELKGSPPENKQSLLQKGKAWIVKNQEFLGAGASIVRTALGIPEVM